MSFNYQETLPKILNFLEYQKDCVYDVRHNENFLKSIIKSYIPYSLLSYISSNRIWMQTALYLLSCLKYSNKIVTPDIILMIIALMGYDSYIRYIVITKNNNILLLLTLHSRLFVFNLLDNDDEIVVFKDSSMYTNLIDNGNFEETFNCDKLKNYEYNHFTINKKQFRYKNMFTSDILYFMYYHLIYRHIDNFSKINFYKQIDFLINTSEYLISKSNLKSISSNDYITTTIQNVYQNEFENTINDMNSHINE
jgi:hypothetical protein